MHVKISSNSVIFIASRDLELMQQQLPEILFEKYVLLMVITVLTNFCAHVGVQDGNQHCVLHGESVGQKSGSGTSFQEHRCQCSVHVYLGKGG